MFLFTSDWHLTSRTKDEYRWDIFPWLTRQAQLRNVKAIMILGDIADAKDHHSNEFINRLVDELKKLSETCPVYMMAGNHDYTNPEAPLLRFLDQPPLVFFSKPSKQVIGGKRFLFVPNQKTQVSLTRTLTDNKAGEFDFVLLHQTFRGSITSNGFELKGFDDVEEKPGVIYISGDVHVPQVIGNVTYCGSPHPVHFGDTYKPRVLFWDGKELKSVPRVTIQKSVLVINDIRELDKLDDVSEGDQVKVILKLPRSKFGEWEEARIEIDKRCTEKELVLCGMELQEKDPEERIKGAPPRTKSKPLDVYKSFCEQNEVPIKLVHFGEKFLEDA